jgi:hypothetical protein
MGVERQRCAESGRRNVYAVSLQRTYMLIAANGRSEPKIPISAVFANDS